MLISMNFQSLDYSLAMSSGLEGDSCETSSITTISTSTGIPFQSRSSLIAKAFAVSALKVASPSGQQVPVSQDNG